MLNHEVTLRTSDKVNIRVERHVAEQSFVIKTMLEDLGCEPDEPIPIFNVNEEVMRKVIKWCELYKNNKPTNSKGYNTRSMDISEWEEQFMDVVRGMLFDIIMASSYLEIEPLLNLGYKTAANRIRGKSLEEIRATFSIPLGATTMAQPLPTAPPSPPPIDAGLPFSHTIHPTPTAALAVRTLLTQLPLHGGGTLPPEHAIAISALGYSPWLTARRVHEREYEANDFWRPGPYASVVGLYLSAGPLPVELGRVIARRIVFQTRVADQGWATFGGNGTLMNSHTWFEASILRRVAGDARGNEEEAVLDDVLTGTWENVGETSEVLREVGWELVSGVDGQVVWKVCNGITASSQYRDYKVDWRRGVRMDGDEKVVGKSDGFLERLEEGSVVVLWARAEQQGWVNKVAAATIEIEYELL